MSTLLFVDVATSGFEAMKDHILEVACMLVSADPTLEVLETFHAIVSFPCDEEGIPNVPSRLPEFHVKNGLTEECFDYGESLSQIESHLLAGPWSRATRLVNRGPDFDRRFLAAHMPTFARSLPTATLDVNQIEYAVVALGGVPQIARPVRTYRAEDDLAEAYEALRYYLNRKGI